MMDQSKSEVDLGQLVATVASAIGQGQENAVPQALTDAAKKLQFPTLRDIWDGGTITIGLIAKPRDVMTSLGAPQAATTPVNQVPDLTQTISQGMALLAEYNRPQRLVGNQKDDSGQGGGGSNPLDMNQLLRILVDEELISEQESGLFVRAHEASKGEPATSEHQFQELALAVARGELASPLAKAIVQTVLLTLQLMPDGAGKADGAGASPQGSKSHDMLMACVGTAGLVAKLGGGAWGAAAGCVAGAGLSLWANSRKMN
jgi:hypothetical protein